ncbi:MAG: hypothetical protein JSV31_10070, partial [Desulfobacterales bacterium]
QINTETKRVGPILDDLKNSMQNVAQFSAQINAQSKDIPVITQSLKEVLTSVQMVMKNLSQTTPQLPQVVKNVQDTTDTLPVLILQVQQVMVEMERLIKQLQSHWLLGGKSSEHAQTAARISPLEITP